MKFLALAFLAMNTFVCGAANADYPPYVTCNTESAGLTFDKSERDPSLARQLTVSSCTADSRTNNAECRANIFCTPSRTAALY